ncbi:LamG-like jellyroll fold domain-containing protein, partial [Fulvivirga imtechensis]|uniref:LamG-like jellyroll fold domain-containing protein n=1 Tax=Fulvivirga imtechensis TaxID=881893 RepID=UPI00058AC807
AIKLSSTNTIVVQENGNWKGGFGSVTNGDVLRIERTGNTITYKKNGTTIYTSATPSTTSLIADACFYHSGGEINNGMSSFGSAPVTLPTAPTSLTATADQAGVHLSWTDNATNESGYKIERQLGSNAYEQLTTTIADVTSYSDNTTVSETTYTYRVSAYNAAGDSDYSNTTTITTPPAPLSSGTPVTWTDLVGVEVHADNSVVKTAGWGTDNSGAASEEMLAAGIDGWAEFTVYATGKERYFGFSQTNPDATNNIDYAFKLNSVNKIVVTEGGQTQAGFGDIINGDVLRIERTGSAITYKQNGTVLYTSATPSTSSLLVDVSFYHTGGEINNANVSFAAPPFDPSAWNFNTCSGTTLTDSSGGLDGTIHGGAQWTAGYQGQGLLLDGEDDYGRIPDDASNDFGGRDFTVAYWVKKLSATNNYDNLMGVGKWNNGGNVGANEWTLNLGGQYNEYPRFIIESGATKYHAISATALNLNQWYHLAGVREGPQIKLYQDGVLVATTDVGSGVINNTTLPVYIGRMAATGYNTHAVFDEVKIYNTALTATEISQLAALPSDPVSCINGNVDDTAEIAALQSLYQSSGGTSWTDKTGWPTDWSTITSVDQITGWYGITTENGDVTGINLSNNNLAGSIPASFGNLTELQILRMNNSLFGGGKGGSLDLNTLLAPFTKLRELSFENCGIATTSFPAVISDLHSLEYLSLANNAISGQIPAFSNHTNLVYLDISSNKLNGVIPASLASLPNLQYLNLSKNTLMGAVPNFPVTSRLEELDLSKTLITQLPDLKQSPDLAKVDVHQCQLTFSEIEKQLTAANTSPFEFIYHNQLPQSYDDYIEVQTGGVLEINSLDASTYNVYLWEKLEEDGGNLIATDVTGQNENTDGSIFKLSN